MRKLAAILMLGIFAFNIAGYQLMYNYLASRSDAALELQLDEKSYNEADLISIKQATNLPYYTNNETFQRIDGEVEIDGIKYKYVKSRIYNDSLEMLCIPHTAKMKIEQSKNDYAAATYDFQQGNNKKKSTSESNAYQKSLSEYEEQVLPAFSNTAVLVKNKFGSFYTVPPTNHFFNTAEQPPETAII